MKKTVVILMVFSLAIIVSLINLNTPVWAQKSTKSIVEKKSSKKTVPAKKLFLPDLIVSNIVLIKDCKIKVTIKNISRAGVPDIGYHMTKGTAVQMYKNNVPWGGIRLGAIDPAEKLKTPGASVSHIWFPGAANLNLGPGTHSVKVEVDGNNAVKESNENNNKKTVRLGCKDIVNRGDLSVEIKHCPGSIAAGQNLGSGFQVLAKSTFANAINDVAVDIILTSNPTYPMPAPYAIYSPNYSNNVLLKGGREFISFTGPGVVNVKLNGNNQIPVDTPPGVYYLAAVVDAGNKVTEINEQNNVAFCRIKVGQATQSLPDLVVTGFAYSGAAPGQPLVPKLLVTINNLGPSAIPLGTNAKLKVYVNGSLVATVDLDDSSVEQTAFHDVHNAYDPVNPGKSRSMVGTSYIFPSGGRYACRAVIDSTNTIAESNEGNNTFTRVEVIPDY
ncbi:MAG: hypothetical protein K8R67_03025 [Desulfobacteraceae bacterium]|nr:hypothetical protein [Desulfobacteraceae bacterium]